MLPLDKVMIFDIKKRRRANSVAFFSLGGNVGKTDFLENGENCYD